MYFSCKLEELIPVYSRAMMLNTFNDQVPEQGPAQDPDWLHESTEKSHGKAAP